MYCMYVHNAYVCTYMYVYVHIFAIKYVVTVFINILHFKVDIVQLLFDKFLLTWPCI